MSHRDAARPPGNASHQAASVATTQETPVPCAPVLVDDRWRIERDIHDGVQQRLTALRIRLAMAADRYDAGGQEDVRAMLIDFGTQVDQAIDELSEVAHGFSPPLLASAGLGDSLAAAASN